jgi:hypothetical protein
MNRITASNGNMTLIVYRPIKDTKKTISMLIDKGYKVIITIREIEKILK